MKIVVLLSGGLDSSTLLYWLKRKKHHVFPLAVNYGQKHVKELESAKKIAASVGGEPLKVIEIPAFAALAPTSSQTNSEIAVPEGHYADETMKLTVVPNRNMVLLSLATAYAVAVGADAVAYAAHAGDHAIYPDCRPEFARAMVKAMKLCDFKPVKLISPFIKKTKAQIVKKGKSLKVPYAETWSCYKGVEKHCGKCGTCVERVEAFKLAGVPDPTIYE